MVMCMTTFISLPVLSYSTWYEIINSGMAILSFGLLPIVPLFVIGFLHKFREKLKDQEFRMKFVTLYFGVNTRRPFAKLVVPLFLTRRLLFAIAVVVLSEYTSLQIIINLIFSVFYLAFLIHVKPM